MGLREGHGGTQQGGALDAEADGGEADAIAGGGDGLELLRGEGEVTAGGEGGGSAELEEVAAGELGHELWASKGVADHYSGRARDC